MRQGLTSLFLLLTLTAALHAQVTIGPGFSNGDPVASDGPTFNFSEVFTAPAAGNNVLESFTYWYFNETGNPASVVTSLYAWNGSAATGAALFTGTTGLSSAFTYSSIDYTDIAAALVPGAQYIMSSVANDNNVTIASDYHGGASSNQYYQVEDYSGTYYNQPGNSLDFTATFDAGGAITPVPEMNSLEWAGIGLCAALGLWQFRRSRSQETASISA